MAKIYINAEFDTVEEAIDFMSGAGHPRITVHGDSAIRVPRKAQAKDPTPLPVTTPAAATAAAAGAPQPAAPKAPEQTTAAPVAPAAAPVAAAPNAAAVALVMPTAQPAPQPAAPKQPNAPVQAVANANKQPVPLHPATQDGVRAALKDVFNLRGATVATELLKKHGAVSVSTVAKEQYTNFVNACAAS